MRKLVFPALLILFCQVVAAQTFSGSFGINRNNFFDFRRSEVHFRKAYTPGYGFAGGLETTFRVFDSLLIKTAVRYEKFSGSLYTADGAMGAESSTRADVAKQIIGVELYPFNYTFFEKVHLGIGAGFSFLLSSEVRGKRESWNAAQPWLKVTDLGAETDFVNRFNREIGVYLGYRFVFGNTVIEPQYKYYYGLSPEFSNIEAKTRSMRHTVAVAIGYLQK